MISAHSAINLSEPPSLAALSNWHVADGKRIR
jgi:hypothetical protein